MLEESLECYDEVLELMTSRHAHEEKILKVRRRHNIIQQRITSMARQSKILDDESEGEPDDLVFG